MTGYKKRHFLDVGEHPQKELLQRLPQLAFPSSVDLVAVGLNSESACAAKIPVILQFQGGLVSLLQSRPSRRNIPLLVN